MVDLSQVSSNTIHLVLLELSRDQRVTQSLATQLLLVGNLARGLRWSCHPGWGPLSNRCRPTYPVHCGFCQLSDHIVRPTQTLQDLGRLSRLDSIACVARKRAMYSLRFTPSAGEKKPTTNTRTFGGIVHRSIDRRRVDCAIFAVDQAIRG